MKAGKYIAFILVLVLISCEPDPKEYQTLDPSTKDYFDVKNQSEYIFSEISDSFNEIKYVTDNYINTHANPDIENNEIISYDLIATGFPKLTIRCESGGLQYKDRVALLTTKNDSVIIGPIVFNLGAQFSVGFNSGDSVFQLPMWSVMNRNFSDVVRIKPKNNLLYSEIYYARNIGLIARKEKNGKFYYLKRYQINR